MDALIRWLNAQKGRRLAMAADINVTRSAVSQMLKRAYLPANHIDKIKKFTGIPHKYLVRRYGEGLDEQELAELDAIARKRELKAQEEQIAKEKADLLKLKDEINGG